MALSEHRRSTSSGRQDTVGRLVLLVLGTWVAATVVVIGVAAETKIGPVVLPLSFRHGIHLGDLATMVVAYGAAILLTAWAVERYRAR